MEPIEIIRDEVYKYGGLIDAPKSLLSIPDQPIGNGTPHVEIHSSDYHYVVSERGIEYSRIKTKDIDELMYWIFSDITSSMSFSYEVKNRIERQDIRRVIFKCQLNLLRKMNYKWAEKETENIESIIKNNPYVDE